MKVVDIERLKVQMPLERLEERIDRQPRTLNLGRTHGRRGPDDNGFEAIVGLGDPLPARMIGQRQLRPLISLPAEKQAWRLQKMLGLHSN